MKPIGGYDKAQAFTEVEKLPIGGYIIGILSAEEINYSWGSVLEVKFDIANGEYKNFYTNQYKNSQLEDKKYKGTYRMNIPKEDGSDMDEWTIRKFKSDITAIEESNPGFHWAWDEAQLKGKKAGAVFHDKEWEFNGNTGFYTALHSFRSIQQIKDGKFKIPKPKLLKKDTAQSTAYGNGGAVSDFTELDDTGDLPFD